MGAARAEFARVGYEGASLRGIAREAGVDPALVHHYFDGKAGLFAESVVLVSLPSSPPALVKGILARPRAEIGRAGVQAFLGVWEVQGETFVALMRSISGSEEVAGAVREFLAREVFGRIAAGLEPDLPPAELRLRAGLAAAQMMGLAMARYVVAVPGVADATTQELVERVGPVLQAYLLPTESPRG